MSESISLTPTLLEHPIFPVTPGSVLSQLLESTNTSSARCPTIVTFGEDSLKLSPSKSFSKPKSKIPTKCSNTQGFERSLRKYAHCSASATPTSRSRASSPNPSNSSRATSPNSRRVYSKIPSIQDSNCNTRQGIKVAATCLNRPPALPKGPPHDLQQVSNVRTEPRPVRLAYGINGIQYQNQLKALEANNYSLFLRSKEKQSSCCGGNVPGGDRMTKKLVRDPDYQQRFTRTTTPAYQTLLPKIERPLSIQNYTPVKGENDVILCPCEYEEKACQTISAELLSISRKKKNNAIAIRDDDDNILGTISKEEKTDYETGQCRNCGTDAKNRSEKQDVPCQSLHLQGTVIELKKALEDLSFRNEMLELQLFENIENKEKLLEIETKKRALNHDDTSPPPSTINIGVGTEEDICQRLKYPLENFLRSKLARNHVPIVGDAGEEGDDVDLKADQISKELKITQLALSTRDAVLNEIQTKLKKGFRILQKRCDDSIKLPESGPLNNNDPGAVSYKTISPPEANRLFHSYRKFLRFINTYVDQSLSEIYKCDTQLFKLESTKSDEIDDDTSSVKLKSTDKSKSCDIIGESSVNDEVELNRDDEDANNYNNSQFELSPGKPEHNFHLIRSPNDQEMISPQDHHIADDWTPALLLETESKNNSTLVDSDSTPAQKTSSKKISVAEWFMLPEEKKKTVSSPPSQPEVGDNKSPSTPFAAAKRWLERTPSPLTTFILDPISFTNLLNPLYDPIIPSVNEEVNSSDDKLFPPANSAADLISFLSNTSSKGRSKFNSNNNNVDENSPPPSSIEMISVVVDSVR